MDQLKKNLPPPLPESPAELEGKDAIFIPIDSPIFYAWFDKNAASFPPEILPSFKSFRKNLEGTSATIFIPVLVGVGLGMKKRLDALHQKEKIARGLKEEDESREALRAAKDQFEIEIDDPEKRHSWAAEAMASLEYLYRSKQYEHAAFELLRQGSVLAWLALENLVHDSLLTFLRSRPDAADDFLKDEALRKRFALEYPLGGNATKPGFDSARALAGFFVAFRTPGAPGAMQEIFRVLLPKAAQLQSLLRRRELLILNQRYHLITHRCGRVDQAYLDATHEHLNLNTLITVSSQDVREYLSIVRDTGIEILKGLAEQLPVSG